MERAVVDSQLDQAHLRLETHFASLFAERKLLGLPVFAIEHGLDQDELAQISIGIRWRLAHWLPLHKHWLLWVVYAAEVGYDYDGEEYWPSFERRTPHWSNAADRRQTLRQWYRKFHSVYGGVVPSGLWASHFSIIAEPITHALLPKDLQYQLSRILFEHRYQIAELIESPPTEVGHFMCSVAYYASSRLRNLFEQEELVGRIVLALLGTDRSDNAASILPVTLERIVHDLEAVQNAKMWLREARDAATAARIKLLAKKAWRESKEGLSSNDKNLENVEAKAVRPSMRLRPTGLGWTALLEIPSFAGLAASGPLFGSFLRSTRCRVAGTGDSWHPRGWLLFGMQRKVLTSWPDPQQPVIRFERFDQYVYRFLVSECKISEGPQWLFKIGDDGLALQVNTKTIAPGHDYIVVQKEEIPSTASIEPIRIDCAGIYAARINLPLLVSDDLRLRLTALGLRTQKSVLVWAAGLPTANTIEGRLEWLEPDSKIIGVMHQGGCTRVELQVQGSPSILISEPENGQPTFIDLGSLSIGTKILTITGSFSDGESEKVEKIKNTIPIIVRPAHRWIPGVAAHSGLLASIEPHEPTLDEVISGRTELRISGPEKRTISIELHLLDDAGKPILAEEIGNLRLPMGRDDWALCIERWHEKKHDPSFSSRASAGKLVVASDGMGSRVIPLRHKIVPIRWIARGTKILEIKLTDDTSHEEPIIYEHASYLAPTEFKQCQFSERTPDIKPLGHGGVYIASCANHRAAIVVSVPGITSLKELANRPSLKGALSNGDQVVILLNAIRDWTTAKPVGPLVKQRATLAIRAMEYQLFETMCSYSWIAAEKAYREKELTSILENAVDAQVSFALSVSSSKEDMYLENIEDSSEQLRSLCVKYRITNDPRLCEAALRLAGTPGRFNEWAGLDAVKLLNALVYRKPLLRAARMALLVLGDRGVRNAQGWPT
jgi:hypothetical protein